MAPPFMLFISLHLSAINFEELCIASLGMGLLVGQDCFNTLIESIGAASALG